MTIVRQRSGGDCAIAVLATLAGVSYEAAGNAAAKIERARKGTAGLYNREVVAIAKQLGVALQPTRDYDLELDAGVLRVRWEEATEHRGGHFVALSAGLILCPREGVARPWREYLAVHRARTCTLLRTANAC